MLCVPFKFFIWILSTIWTLTVLCVNAGKGDSCSEWNLVGGREAHEGIIEFKYQGVWYNLCENSFTKKIRQYEMCKELNLTSGKGTMYYHSNVFNASLNNETIPFKENCNETYETKKVCTTDGNVNCCHPVGICCIENSLQNTCSANWLKTYDKPCYKQRRLSYREIRDLDFGMTNHSKSWTKTALATITTQNCSEPGGLSDALVRDCWNRCFGNKSVEFCKCPDGPLQNNAKCHAKLTVVNDKTKDVRLCVAAEVINGHTKFTAENCETFLQPFCVDKAKTTNPDSIDDQSTTESKTTRDNETNNVIVATIVALTCIILVVAVVVLCICCRKNTKRDPFRTNSICNRTYDRQMQRKDEEYAIISEIELDSGTTIYKPPLPDRGTSLSENTYHTVEHGRNIEVAAITTLADYSTPSDMVRADMVRDKSEVNPADEYMTTYDDPIRHNLQNTAECKRKSEIQDICEKQTTETDSDHNKIHQASQSCESTVNTGKGASVNEDVLLINEEKGKQNDDNNSTASSENHTTRCDVSISVQKRVKKSGDDMENYNPPVLEEAVSAANKNDYDDTNIIDGNYPARPKGIFEEHVCLHCLKPEHLKRLGIKIIFDKTLDSIERRLSEPPYNTEASETDTTLRRCLTAESHKSREKDLIDFSGNSDKDENIKECIVCNNVYDCVGHIKKKANTKGDLNEYDHLSNWKKVNSGTSLMDDS